MVLLSLENTAEFLHSHMAWHKIADEATERDMSMCPLNIDFKVKYALKVNAVVY